VEVGFDHPAEGEAQFFEAVDVEVYVALRVDHGGLALVVDEVGGVGEATEIEAFDGHGFRVIREHIPGAEARTYLGNKDKRYKYNYGDTGYARMTAPVMV
jgi:hypothetical protein